jgi:hypothetical protein
MTENTVRLNTDDHGKFLPSIDIAWFETNGNVQADIKVGNRGTKRVVPPAGERYAFEVTEWARRVTVSVSPSGRSVRVWVDGHEIPRPETDKERLRRQDKENYQ